MSPPKRSGQGPAAGPVGPDAAAPPPASPQPPKRSYQDACAAAHALDLVGERWALLVARELILGPKRFSDLKAGLPGISPNVLSQRLGELEAAGVLERVKLPPPAATMAYQLTPWGLGLEDVIQALGRWAVRSPQLHRPVPMGVDGLILSFRTMFCPQAAQGLKLHLELRLGEDCFEARVADGALAIQRGLAPQAPTRVACGPMALMGLVYGGQGLDDALRAGQLQLEGDRQGLVDFVRLFPTPGPAA